MLIDSHCHLNMLDAYPDQLGNLIEEAKASGVERILCIGVDLIHAEQVIKIAEQFPNVSASVGMHPSEPLDHELTAEELIQYAKHPKVIAIGETGLDYYYPDTNPEMQQRRFRLHIEVAKELEKPLIIHTRSAQEDTIKILREENAQEIGGIMHCFTETVAMAEQAMELGFYISISGIVTFKKATNVMEIAKAVPLDRLLIETDAPYLAPVPFRGKQNQPKWVRYVAEYIAELKQISFQEVAEATTQNFYKLFKEQL